MNDSSMNMSIFFPLDDPAFIGCDETCLNRLLMIEWYSILFMFLNFRSFFMILKDTRHFLRYYFTLFTLSKFLVGVSTREYM